MNSLLSKYSLSLQEADILIFISKNGKRFREIGYHLGINHKSVKDAIYRMKYKGFVETKEIPNDPLKSVLCVPTEKGKEFLRDIINEINKTKE